MAAADKFVLDYRWSLSPPDQPIRARCGASLHFLGDPLVDGGVHSVVTLFGQTSLADDRVFLNDAFIMNINRTCHVHLFC
jgi:hypothetical protein